jgi:hypothetical protein
MIPDRFRKFEPFLFILFVIAGMFPVLSTHYFPTLDGPAHQYNARLIHHLLSGDIPVVNWYFTFSTELVPNWFGHVLLYLFNLILPSVMAEKAVLLCYVVGLPLSFRYFITSFNKENVGISYLIFPFVYTLFFLMGFYNFNLALVLLFLASGYWMRSGSHPGWLRYLGMFFLITCTYFAHLFVFVVLLMSLGLYEAGGLVRDYRKNLRSAIVLMALCLPCVLLSVVYLKGHVLPERKYVSWKDLTNFIRNMSPLITLNYAAQVKYSRAAMYMVLGLFSSALFLRLRLYFRTPKETRGSFLAQFNAGDSWLALSPVLLVLYYTLPDSDGIAGYVSLRLCLLFFLALLAWVSWQKLPDWLVIAAIFVSAGVFQNQIRFHSREIKTYDSIAQECHKASGFLQPNTVVMPVNYMSNWMLAHFSNYLGHEKPVVILENYEASLPFFPLRFGDGDFHRSPDLENPMNECTNYPWNQYRGYKTVDYVFSLGNSKDVKDSCTAEVDQLIGKYYTLLYKGNWVKLYGLNR